MARTIEVEMTVDASGAVKSVSAAGKEFRDLSEAAETAGESVDESMSEAAASTTKAGDAAENASGSMRTLAAASDQAADAQVNMRRAGSNATQVLFSAGDAVQDMQFGLVGVSNNLAFMAEQFATVQTQAGGTRGALKAIGGSLFGVGGAIFAFQILLNLAPKIISFFSDTEGEAKDLEKAIQDVADGLVSIQSAVDDTDLEVSADDAAAYRDALQQAVTEQEQFIAALDQATRGGFFSQLADGASDFVSALTGGETTTEEALQGAAQAAQLLGLEIETVRRAIQGEQSALLEVERVLGAQPEILQEANRNLDIRKALLSDVEAAIERQRVKQEAVAAAIAAGAKEQGEQADQVQRTIEGLERLAALSVDGVPGVEGLIPEDGFGLQGLATDTERMNFLLRVFRRRMQSGREEGIAFGEMLSQGITQGVVTAANAIAQGENVFRALGQLFGNLMQRIGAAMVAFGLGLDAIRRLEPIEAIAGGTALIAAGAALKAFLGQASSSVGGGGGQEGAGIEGGSFGGGPSASVAGAALSGSAASLSGVGGADPQAPSNGAVVKAIEDQTRRLEQIERVVRVEDAYDRLVDYDARQGARGRPVRFSQD